MTDKEHITAAGGWCAPARFSVDSLDVWLANVITFPDVATRRGGITFDFVDRRTDAERRADDVAQALRLRIVERAVRQRRDAVEAACRTAWVEGWDVHVYDPPEPFDLRRASDRDLLYLQCVGIAFTPAKHSIPTIHEHPCPDYWDDEDY